MAHNVEFEGFDLEPLIACPNGINDRIVKDACI
jgi:hypothetical protein